MSCHEKISSGHYCLVTAYPRNPKTWIPSEKKSVTRGDFCLLFPAISLSSHCPAAGTCGFLTFWSGHLQLSSLLIAFKTPNLQQAEMSSCGAVSLLPNWGKLCLTLLSASPQRFQEHRAVGWLTGETLLWEELAQNTRNLKRMNWLCGWGRRGVSMRMKFKPNVLQN